MGGTFVLLVGTKLGASGVAAAIFPRSRRAILGLLYSQPDEEFYLRQVVELTGLAVGQVQRELNLLSSNGILQREARGRHVYFRVDPSCPIFEELRGIVTKTVGAVHVIGEALGPLANRIEVAFVFGSVARSQESRDSDIDVMVVGTLPFGAVAQAIRGAERNLRRDVNLLVYPAEELRAKTRAGHSFLREVIAGAKVFVVGDEDELAALLAEPLAS